MTTTGRPQDIRGILSWITCSICGEDDCRRWWHVDTRPYPRSNEEPNRKRGAMAHSPTKTCTCQCHQQAVLGLDWEIAQTECREALKIMHRALYLLDRDQKEASQLLNDVANLAGRAAFRLVNPIENWEQQND